MQSYERIAGNGVVLYDDIRGMPSHAGRGWQCAKLTLTGEGGRRSPLLHIGAELDEGAFVWIRQASEVLGQRRWERVMFVLKFSHILTFITNMKPKLHAQCLPNPL